MARILILESRPDMISGFDVTGEVVGVEFLEVAKKKSQQELPSVRFESG